MFIIHYKYVVVPADNAPINIFFICKKQQHYIDCLMTELGFDNPTYGVTKLSIEKIMEHHMSVLSSFSLSVNDDDYDLRLEFWIPCKQRYIAAATKPLSKIVASIFTAVKTGLQKYHDICFSRGGVNQMWMLKNSKY